MNSEEDRFRKAVFGRDFGSIFLEYQVEEWERLGTIKKVAFIIVYPILLLIGLGCAIHARCYMLFLGRCF